MPRPRRLTAAALVCRRWHSLVHTPALLEGLEFRTRLAEPYQQGRVSPLDRCASFARFLCRHAGAVSHLTLHLHARKSALRGSKWTRTQAPKHLRACLRACAAAGALRSLRCCLHLPSEWVAGSLAALTSLRQLTIEGLQYLNTSLAPLACCTRLDLHLSTRAAAPKCALPPALAHLTLGRPLHEGTLQYECCLQLPLKVRWAGGL